MNHVVDRLPGCVLAQNLKELRHGGALLAYSHVDAVEVRRLVRRGVDGLKIHD